MKGFLKIVLLIAAIFPIWLTLAAFGETSSTLETSVSVAAPRTKSVTTSHIPSDAWKEKLNNQLLKYTTRKIQITEMLMTSEYLEESWLGEKFEVETADIRPQGSNVLTLKFMDDQGRLNRLVRLPAMLYVEDKYWVATREIQRGTKIESTDLRLEWKESTNLSRTIPNSADIVGRIARMNMSAGDVFTESSLERQHLISKGDRIKIMDLKVKRSKF